MYILMRLYYAATFINRDHIAAKNYQSNAVVFIVLCSHEKCKRYCISSYKLIELFDGAMFSGSSTWKVVQAGVKMSTTSVLQISNTLVASGDSKFLLTIRMNQNAVEKVFSQIRGKGDTYPSIIQYGKCCIFGSACFMRYHHMHYNNCITVY